MRHHLRLLLAFALAAPAALGIGALVAHLTRPASPPTPAADDKIPPPAVRCPSPANARCPDCLVYFHAPGTAGLDPAALAARACRCPHCGRRHDLLTATALAAAGEDFAADFFNPPGGDFFRFPEEEGTVTDLKDFPGADKLLERLKAAPKKPFPRERPKTPR